MEIFIFLGGIGLLLCNLIELLIVYRLYCIFMNNGSRWRFNLERAIQILSYDVRHLAKEIHKNQEWDCARVFDKNNPSCKACKFQIECQADCLNLKHEEDNYDD